MSHGQRLTCPSRKESGCRLSTTREWHCPECTGGVDPSIPRAAGRGRCRARRAASALGGGWWPSLDPDRCPPLSWALPLHLSFSLSLLLSRWPLGGRWMSGVYRGQVEGDASLRLGAALCMCFSHCPCVWSPAPSPSLSLQLILYPIRLSQPFHLLPTPSC